MGEYGIELCDGAQFNHGGLPNDLLIDSESVDARHVGELRVR